MRTGRTALLAALLTLGAARWLAAAVVRALHVLLLAQAEQHGEARVLLAQWPAALHDVLSVPRGVVRFAAHALWPAASSPALLVLECVPVSALLLRSLLRGVHQPAAAVRAACAAAAAALLGVAALHALGVALHAVVAVVACTPGSVSYTCAALYAPLDGMSGALLCAAAAAMCEAPLSAAAAAADVEGAARARASSVRADATLYERARSAARRDPASATLALVVWTTCACACVFVQPAQLGMLAACAAWYVLASGRLAACWPCCGACGCCCVWHVAAAARRQRVQVRASSAPPAAAAPVPVPAGVAALALALATGGAVCAERALRARPPCSARCPGALRRRARFVLGAAGATASVALVWLAALLGARLESGAQVRACGAGPAWLHDVRGNASAPSLVVLMPTCARAGAPPYVLQAVESLLVQWRLNGMLQHGAARAHLALYDNCAAAHAQLGRVATLEAMLGADDAVTVVHMHAQPVDDASLGFGMPLKRDTIRMLEHARDAFSTARYYFVLEDDFVACVDGWRRALETLCVAERDTERALGGEPCGVFVGTGGAGLFVHRSALPVLLAALRAPRHAFVPHDVVMQTCLQGRDPMGMCAGACTDRLTVSEGMLFRHTGEVSTHASGYSAGSDKYRCGYRNAVIAAPGVRVAFPSLAPLRGAAGGGGPGTV